MNHALLKKSVVYLGILTFSSSFAQTFNGQIERLVLDDFNKNQTEYKYQLKEGNKRYELKISPKMINQTPLQAGDKVTVDGEIILEGRENRIIVNSILVKKPKAVNNDLVGQRNVLALLINFTDIKATDAVSTSIVDQELYTNPVSVSNNYVKSSANQFKFIRVPDSTGNPGIFPITLNYAASNTCDFFKWADDATAAASQAGINVSSFFHRLYILPSNVNCPWAGIADLGCGAACEAWVVAGGDITALMAHELGHNLGINHSSTNLNNAGSISEYGDASDFMGPASNRQLNAPHRDQLQWFQSFPGKITTVTASGQFIINSLDVGDNALEILRVNKKNNAGTYYISYRTNAAPFGMGAPYSGNVNIHYTNPGDNHSFFVTAIGPAQTFVDSANGVTISVLANFMGCASIVNVTLS